MTTKVLDYFNGTVGTDIDVHTPDIDIVGGGWTDGGANTVELDGSGGIKFAASNNNCYIDCGTTDAWGYANWNSNGADNRCAFNLRDNGASFGSETAYYYNFRPGDGTGAVYMYRTVSGSHTQIGSATGLGYSTSTTYSIEPVINGTNWDFRVDGASVISNTDSTISTGGHARLRHALYNSGGGTFFDIQVDDAAPGGVTTSLYYYMNNQ